MSTFVPTKHHLRVAMLHEFLAKKSAAETYRLLVEIYGQHAPSEASCRKWFQRFKTGNYDLEDREHGKPIKKFQDDELKRLLNENPNRTLKELAELLNVDKSTVSRRLHALGMVQKEDNK